MENMEIVRQKKLLDLAMDLYFLNGAKSESFDERAIESVKSGYDHFFGENASEGLSEQKMIINALACYEDLTRLIEASKKQGSVGEFTRDDLIISQKRLINIAKELSFISGAKSDKKLSESSERYLVNDYESIFGKGSSKGKSFSRLAGDVLARLESINYAGLGAGERANG